MLMVASRWALAQTVATNTDLPNFHQVSDTLYRGAQPTEKGVQFLAGMGLKSIINLRAADENSKLEEQWAAAAGLRYFNVPMDGWGRPTDEQVENVLSLLNTPANQPVFLHCKRGKDRTGAIVACYRISRQHWNSRDAIQEARGIGMRWSEFGMKRYVQAFYNRGGEFKKKTAKAATELAGDKFPRISLQSLLRKNSQ